MLNRNDSKLMFKCWQWEWGKKGKLRNILKKQRKVQKYDSSFWGGKELETKEVSISWGAAELWCMSAMGHYCVVTHETVWKNLGRFYHLYLTLPSPVFSFFLNFTLLLKWTSHHFLSFPLKKNHMKWCRVKRS